MSILNKEILPAGSPVVLGFQHFLLTAAIFCGTASVLGAALFAAIIFLAYSGSDFLLWSLMAVLVAASAAIATLILKTKITTSGKIHLVPLWGGLFGYIFILFFLSIGVQSLEEFLSGVSETLLILIGAFLLYYSTTVAVLKLKRSESI